MTTKASGQITITNLNSAIVAGSEPSNPTSQQIWVDTSVVPNLIKEWNGTGWDTLGEMAAEGISTAVTDLSDDNKLTRFERNLVRDDIGNITGVWMAAADNMPTLATVDSDSYNKGGLYAIRKTARSFGVDQTDTSNYKKLGDAYTNLANYLSGLTPKPWDVSSTATTAITAAIWDQKWNDYNNYYTLLQIEVQDRQQELLLTAQADAIIAAVSNAAEKATATIANPMIIHAPIATIGLPEFQGYHFDSWNWNYRNLILNSGVQSDTTGWSLSTGITRDSTMVNDGAVSFLYNVTGLATDAWRSATPTNVPVSAGTVVSASAEVYIPSGHGIDIGKPTLEIQYYNSSGTRIGTSSAASSLTILDTWQRLTISNATVPATAVAMNARVWIQRNGKCWVSQVKLNMGAVAGPYTPAPEDSWAKNGNRIQPITNPTFSSGVNFTIMTQLYGDGTNNDSIVWDTKGNIIKTKKWEDTTLDGDYSWSMDADATGYKTLKATGFAPDVTPDTVQAVKFDNSMLSRIPSANSFSAADQVRLGSSDNALYISVSDSDSGWGESYTPLPEEIDAYFLGWEMCNGTYNTKYTGAVNDVKIWYPIGDTNLDRATFATNGVPTTLSPTMNEKAIKQYQVVYQLGTPIQQTGITYDGVLALVQGDNTITIAYPDWSPAIVTGTIKYATNLATVQQDLSYIIPTVMKRVASAESKITDDAIVATVTESISYKTALKTVDDLLVDVDDLNRAVSGINLSDYVTTTTMNTTAKGIKEEFFKGGGMNQIDNSVGYAGLDFWTDYTSTKVATIQNEDLTSLGFGSGFQFKADGLNKGITQDITVKAGQHYVLSWYLNKITSGADSSFRFWIQILEDGNIISQIDDNSASTTNGYEAAYMNMIIPTTTKITVRFIAYGNCEAILSGVMLTIGDTPIPWTLSAGEAYNTYITMNSNGIRVSNIEDGVETWYTMMAPDEFSGWNLNNGSFEKVFYLNGDETVTKKLTATNEINMGTIKVIPVSLPNNTGWAFVPNN